MKQLIELVLLEYALRAGDKPSRRAPFISGGGGSNPTLVIPSDSITSYIDAMIISRECVYFDTLKPHLRKIYRMSSKRARGKGFLRLYGVLTGGEEYDPNKVSIERGEAEREAVWEVIEKALAGSGSGKLSLVEGLPALVGDTLIIPTRYLPPFERKLLRYSKYSPADVRIVSVGRKSIKAFIVRI
ncbi:hypothetical protein [Pyrococcus kukulkanii]|uniref:hypothetical protein n=1 Tax=Pyrococcus kukulkanii TaxID=1609559 RepID=UPI0035615564